MQILSWGRQKIPHGAGSQTNKANCKDPKSTSLVKSPILNFDSLGPYPKLIIMSWSEVKMLVDPNDPKNINGAE